MGFVRGKSVRLAASAEERATIVAKHMKLSGFSLREITSLLRRAGVVDRHGEPIREAGVRALLAARRRLPPPPS